MAINKNYAMALAASTTKEITSNGEAWKSFLRAAARNYKYPYHDQLMIYAQKPDATACASYELWDEKMNRYVKRGTKGIALFDTRGDTLRLRYVFDVSDTGARDATRDIGLFSMRPEFRDAIQKQLESAFPIKSEDSMERAILRTAVSLAREYWTEHKDEILDAVYDGFPRGTGEDEIGQTFTIILSQSIAYSLMTRCTDEPDTYIDGNILDSVNVFNKEQATTLLGAAVSAMTARAFMEIVFAVREYNREKRKEREHEDLEKGRETEIVNAGDVRETGDTGESGTAKPSRDEGDAGNAGDTGNFGNAGAGSAHEAGISDGRGAALSGTVAVKGNTGIDRQMGADAQGVPQGEQAGDVQPSGTDGEAVSAPVGGTGAVRTAPTADDGQGSESPAAGDEEHRPDGVDEKDEPDTDAVGGDPGTGAYNQLTLNLENSDITKEDVDKLDEEYPVVMEVSDAEFNRILTDGTLGQESKLRIKAYFDGENDAAKRAEFLKTEFGNGGRSWNLPGNIGAFVEYNRNGIAVWRFKDHKEVHFKWSTVVERIAALIAADMFPGREERAEIESKKTEAFTNDGITNPLQMKNAEKENTRTEENPVADTVHHQDTVEQYTDNAATSTPVAPSNQGTDIPSLPAKNYRITNPRLGEGTLKEKFRFNVEAIRTLKKIEVEGRQATEEEQEILSRYVGWGGLAEAFDERKAQWSEEYQELRALLTDSEYTMARSSTLNAHYTSPTVIRAMYEAIRGMGFKSGNILEPSCGVGNFFGMLPESMRGSRLYGVELDAITGRIAKLLYPEADITVAGFESTDRRDFYDLAIGNVPFGQYQVNDRAYNRLGFNVHNYFFAKALDQVRPGGIVAFVTSRYTMDTKSPEVRKYLSERAELIGAIRLPNNAFKANAGTEVVSDIIFLKKRERLVDVADPWVYLDQSAGGHPINSYFTEHPDMVLGNESEDSTQYGRMEYTVIPKEDAPLSEQLSGAISNIRADYEEAASPTIEDLDVADISIPADPNVRNYSYTVVDGEVYYRQNSRMVKSEMNAMAKGRVIGMVELRDLVRELIGLELDENAKEADIQAKQQELEHKYNAFAVKYGHINDRANRLAFSDDTGYYLLCALEILDEEGKYLRKADMFTKRTIRPHKTVNHVDTPGEALEISIAEKTGVDLSYMSGLCGKSRDEIIEGLRGVIYKDPTVKDDPYSGWQTADAYLSGNVRQKLRDAKKAAEEDLSFQINVRALQEVQPKDLEASEIEVRLGATWIDRDYIQQFMNETFKTPFYMIRKMRVNYSRYTAEWNITDKNAPSGSDVAAFETYGTARMSAYHILEDTLNLRDVRVYDTIEDADGSKRRVLNAKETTLAAQKQQAIKEAFRDWIWRDPERRRKLVAQYNEEKNSERPREYDGSHLVFPGMNPEIALRDYQKNAIAHVIYGGNTLLAHEVGAGKTFEMVAAAMESKRLGLCHKPMFVVPNHLTEQWASDFLRLYPSANILVTTKKDFEAKNRKKFCARVATGDYDAIIIGHSQFEKIPVSEERQERLIQEQINEITLGIAELKENHGEAFSIKSMERTKKGLEERLSRMKEQAAGRKDDVLSFEELGVDRLFVDEAHSYKNLFLYTKMRNVAGLSTTDAQKSSDMFNKCRYLDEITGGRGIVFATGTPVSNSMTELYTMQRYLQHEKLKEKDMTHFDCWASQFGETVSAMELAPEGTGYRVRTRFSKFFNLPELMVMVREFADIKTADQLDLNRPEVEYHTEVAKPTGHQKEMVKALSERAAEVHAGNVDPKEDNMLRITSDGRKLGLDQRIINPMLPDESGTKVNRCVENIVRIWQEGAADRLTQLVFCDISTPKSKSGAKKEGAETAEAAGMEFSVYEDIRQKLIACGIPSEEIAFIHDADTEVKKKNLFAKVRAGKVRVLLGSTFKMGAGMNVQDRLVALHDLDCPWRPGDLDQRKGRIERFGNMNKKVHVYRYVTEGTFDAYLWQTVENKQKFISQIMTSKSPVRSCEDIDEAALSYAEIKALCAGDPRIKERMDLDVDVSRLRLMKADYQNRHYRLEDQVMKHLPKEINVNESVLKGYMEDRKTAEEHPHPKDGFAGMTIRGKDYAEKEKAGEELIAVCRSLRIGDVGEIGTYRGFPMEIEFDAFKQQYTLLLRGEITRRVTLGSSALGNIQRIDNALLSIYTKMDAVTEKINDLHKQMEEAKKELEKPFEQEEEFRTKSARLIELDVALNMEKAGDEPSEQEHEDTDHETSDEPELGKESTIEQDPEPNQRPEPEIPFVDITDVGRAIDDSTRKAMDRLKMILVAPPGVRKSMFSQWTDTYRNDLPDSDMAWIDAAMDTGRKMGLGEADLMKEVIFAYEGRTARDEEGYHPRGHETLMMAGGGRNDYADIGR